MENLEVFSIEYSEDAEVFSIEDKKNFSIEDQKIFFIHPKVFFTEDAKVFFIEDLDVIAAPKAFLEEYHRPDHRRPRVFLHRRPWVSTIKDVQDAGLFDRRPRERFYSSP